MNAALIVISSTTITAMHPATIPIIGTSPHSGSLEVVRKRRIRTNGMPCSAAGKLRETRDGPLDSISISDYLPYVTRRARRPWGIEGTIRLDLNFTVAGLESTNAPAGEIENTAPTIFDAIKTLGLALERKPGSIDMFIVDHVEKTPIEN